MKSAQRTIPIQPRTSPAVASPRPSDLAARGIDLVPGLGAEHDREDRGDQRAEHEPADAEDQRGGRRTRAGLGLPAGLLIRLILLLAPLRLWLVVSGQAHAAKPYLSG